MEFSDFLPKNKSFTATFYEDGKTADWNSNPMDYAIKTIQVNFKSKIKLHLVPGGGAAAHFKPI